MVDRDAAQLVVYGLAEPIGQHLLLLFVTKGQLVHNVGEVHMPLSVAQELDSLLLIVGRDVEVARHFVDQHFAFDLTTFSGIKACYCLLVDVVLIFFFQLGRNLQDAQHITSKLTAS